MVGNERRGRQRLVVSSSARVEPMDALLELAEAAMRGKRAATREFLSAIAPDLLRVIRRVLGSEQWLDDAFRASAFAVLDALPRRRRESTVLPFACRVSALTALHARRREVSRQRAQADTAVSSSEKASVNVPSLDEEASLDSEICVRLVRHLLDTSPLEQAEALTLTCVLGQNELEVAESVNLSREIVRARLADAALMLREMLPEGCDEARVIERAALAFATDAPAPAADVERVARVSSSVLQSLRRARISPRVELALKSCALALLIGGIATVAIRLSRWYPHGRFDERTAHAATRARLEGDLKLVPVTHEPAASEAPTKKINAPEAAETASAVPSSASSGSKYRSAADLFAEANQARVAGDVQKAFALSQLLEQNFPNSTEGITTHLSLGVLQLEQNQPALALGEFKIYRHIGSPALMAEALWGEEQALQKLGQVAEERAVLEELLANYPHSAYVGAAEQRLAALNH